MKVEISVGEINDVECLHVQGDFKSVYVGRGQKFCVEMDKRGYMQISLRAINIEQEHKNAADSLARAGERYRDEVKKLEAVRT